MTHRAWCISAMRHDGHVTHRTIPAVTAEGNFSFVSAVPQRGDGRGFGGVVEGGGGRDND